MIKRTFKILMYLCAILLMLLMLTFALITLIPVYIYNGKDMFLWHWEESNKLLDMISEL